MLSAVGHGLRVRRRGRRQHDPEEDARGRRRDAPRAGPDARLSELELGPHADDAAPDEDDAPEPDPRDERIDVQLEGRQVLISRG